MRRILLVTLLLTGCARHAKMPLMAPPRDPHDAPAVHGSACADIRACASIDVTANRFQYLARIAERRELSGHEQIYLIDVTMSAGTTPRQADVLVVLAANAALTQEARQYLARRMAELALVPRDRVAAALAANPPK